MDLSDWSIALAYRIAYGHAARDVERARVGPNAPGRDPARRLAALRCQGSDGDRHRQLRIAAVRQTIGLEFQVTGISLVAHPDRRVRGRRQAGAGDRGVIRGRWRPTFLTAY
jgi:hypothetical protein